MPIATPEVYAQMLDRAKEGRFAYPAINVTSSSSVNAALRGFAEAGSDGILQVSWGGAEFASGSTVKDMVAGAAALAEFATVVARNYPVNVALHTDHCPPDKLEGYLVPLVALSQERVDARPRAAVPVAHVGRLGGLPRGEPQDRRRSCWPHCAKARMVLEVEIGVVGGEEDGVSHEINEKLYTTAEDALRTRRGARLRRERPVPAGGDLRQRARRLQAGQRAAAPAGAARRSRTPSAQRLGRDKPFDLVFHGGSGSALEEIRETLDYGVVKMNIDTDTQYAFTRPIVDHMFKNYDGVLKIDGEVGNKKAYDPRTWGKLAEAGMAARIVAGVRGPAFGRHHGGA